MKLFINSLLTVVLLAFAGSPAWANGGSSGGSGGGSGSNLQQYQKLIDAKQYQQAIDQLEKALAKKPRDADLLNLTAYSHRQLGHLDTALGLYQKALEIEPKHLGANEYMGELYLKMGDLEKAKGRLAVLDSACFFGCEEYDELKTAIEKYQQQHSS